MLKIKNIFGRKKQQPQQQPASQPTNHLSVCGDSGLDDTGSSSTLTEIEQQDNVVPMIPIYPPQKDEKNFSNSYITKVGSYASTSDELPSDMVQSLPDFDFDKNDLDKVKEEEDEVVESEDDSTTTSASSNCTSEDEVPEDIFVEQQELADFILINKIGEGAFSKVFRGIPKKSSSKSFLSRNFSEVAIKVIQKDQNPVKSKRKDDQTKMSTKEQVLKEVTIHKLVSSGSGSEQIVQFVDFQESENYYYIIQELLSGGEIFGEIVKYTYFSEDLSRHVIKQLALAVKHLHLMGVVHRDIKPENLLFEPIKHIPSKSIILRKSDDPNTKTDEGEFRPGIGGGGIGTVKLADFGLSKQIYQTNTKTPCGTVGYTAPEVVKDERYSMKVDMWGIGCVLYTILCGFPPFYDEKIDILTEKISRGEYTFLRPWWDEISVGAKNCVRKLLEVDPEKRYDIDDLLKDEWLNSCDTIKKQELIKKKREAQALDHKRRSKNHLSHKRKMLLLKRDSPLLYSPAANAMRDAFDVSNAVQRIEVDRRAQSQIPMTALAEDEEVFTNGKTQVNGNTDNGLEEDMFQLKLNTSTIIKRRKENLPNQNPLMIPTLIE